MTNWTTIATGETNNTQRQTVDYTSFSGSARGQHLRITGVDRWNSSYGNSIWEVMAYGTYASPGVVSGTISGFTAISQGSTRVALAWAYGGSQLGSITVKRDGTTIATLDGSATSYVDSGLTANTTYAYTVQGTYQANGAATNTASASVTTPTVSTVTRDSGLTFDSGVFISHDEADVLAFEAWRGTLCDVHTVFATNDPGQATIDWNTMLNSWWVRRARSTQKLNLAIPLWPYSGTGNSPTANNDSYWVQLAKMLKDGDSVRMGWEMNLPGWYWHINSSNKNAWIGAWRRAYTAIKSTNPNIHVELCVNAGRSQTSVSNQDLIDGCLDYCDILGIDFYWWWFGTGETPPGETEWNYKLNQEGGLNWWLQRATARGKKVAVSEWGVAAPSHRGYGDQVFPITKYFEWFRANAEHLAHESYFNERGWGGFHIYPTDLNPLAATEYRRQINLSRA